ncbi:MAG TPA: L-seryl-tRNA(Sec) selenium transferase [Chthoniobacterales bacterium]|nr:L-seryl-tRNA(Sec) selenium transferase [Chthoniobacterales bacterium]
MHHKISPRSRRYLPAVNKVLDALDHVDLPRRVIVAIVRRELATLRESGKIVSVDDVFRQVMRALDRHVRSRLQPLINGTGVILHTNFGRAPLSEGARELIDQIATNYSNLEFDLAAGQRGSRAEYLETNLAILCGAEAATIVNNCAAALVLIVRHFTRDKPEIIISRGELVQIGGGFRIGEIVEAAGAKVREVGATNKTSLADYSRAISKTTAMILRAHRSNFFMEGFVDSPSTVELAELARKRRVPLIVDLGSGLIERIEQLGSQDATPAEVLRTGADLVCFSGDKLFGGAQAGIILGKNRLITALKRESLFRALRCDKLTLAALQATVDVHLSDSAQTPALALIKIPKDELRARAANIITRLQGLPAQITVGRGAVKSGGGTSPRAVIPSISIDIRPENCSPNEFAARLRALTPPVIGYIANRALKLDLRTIFPPQDDIVVDAIRSACTTAV